MSPSSCARALSAAWLSITLMAGVGEAQIPAGRMSAPNGYPKDFAVVKREGLFHVFHIEAGAAGDFNYLGHQTSPDLYHWTVQPNVLIAERSDWNPDFVWAPSIIEHDGTYWMFYTGVRRRAESSCPGAPIQQMGVATSTNLMDWTLQPESWLDPTEVGWALQPQDSCAYPSFGGFRDPFVVWDSDTNQWVMLYVTIPSADSTAGNVPQAGLYDPDRYVIGMGKAPMDFAADSDWVDLGALWSTHQAYPNGGGMKTWESPHAFARTWQGQPLWFLFASTGQGLGVDGVSFMTGPKLTLSGLQKKGKPGWTWRGSINNLQIRDQYGALNQPSGWFATEYFRDSETGLEYFANCRIPFLEFRQLKWRIANDGFDLDQPFAIRELLPQPTAAMVGQSIDLSIRAVNVNDGGPPKMARLEVLNVSVAGESLGVSTPASVGLPDSLPITSDVTHVTWIASAPMEPVRRYRVRLAPPATDVQSEIVTVYVPSRGGERPGDPHETKLGTVEERDELRLAARGTPGPLPILSFHLPDRSSVRLDLYDLRGRKVRRLFDRDLPRGSFDVMWDGRDDRGARLRDGVYFVRLETTGGRRQTRLVLLAR